jgi:hypothetical protein
MLKIPDIKNRIFDMDKTDNTARENDSGARVPE